MNTQIKFHSIREWEEAKPDNITYNHFFQKNENGKVTKVTGHVACQVRVKTNGAYKTIAGTKDVRWDAAGRAYSPTSNVRRREYDIRFK